MNNRKVVFIFIIVLGIGSTSFIIPKNMKLIFVPESIKLIKPLRYNSIKKIRIYNSLIKTKRIQLSSNQYEEIKKWISSKDSFIIEKNSPYADFRVHIKVNRTRMAYARFSNVINIQGQNYDCSNLNNLFDSLFIQNKLLE